jgi:hypothetical protein
VQLGIEPRLAVRAEMRSASSMCQGGVRGPASRRASESIASQLRVPRALPPSAERREGARDQADAVPDPPLPDGDPAQVGAGARRVERVAARLRQRREFLRPAPQGPEVARDPGLGATDAERAGQGGGVAGPARQFECLARERGGPVQCAEPGQQPREEGPGKKTTEKQPRA